MRTLEVWLVSPSAISSLHQSANEAVFASMFDIRGKLGMGSTIVGIKFEDGIGFVFNVGDSRAYMSRTTELRQVSQDDTPEKGQTGKRSHALTQCLGESTRPLSIQPHVFECEAPKHLQDQHFYYVRMDSLTYWRTPRFSTSLPDIRTIPRMHSFLRRWMPGAMTIFR